MQQLKHNLTMGPGYEGYIELVKAIDLPPEEYEPLCRWSKDKYQRIRFYDTDSLEGVITCWEPQQEGSIHSFNYSVGWIKVLQGSILMEHFHKDRLDEKPVHEQRYQQGDIAFLNDSLGFHRFSNPDDERAIVLVFYADKMRHWEEYDPKSRSIHRVEVDCDLNLDRLQSDS